MNRDKKTIQQPTQGFTLIELLVVVAIIALLSSVVLIAIQSARQQGRDVRRLGDMTQMNTALELYFATYKGYPSGSAGVPVPLLPEFIARFPVAPGPEDGACDNQFHNAEVTANNGNVQVPANTYYYIPEGLGFDSYGVTVYPSYSYYFCLGSKTSDYFAGERFLSPSGVQ